MPRYSITAKAKAEAAAALAGGDDSDDDVPRMNMGWSADDKEARPPTVSMARRMMSALGLSSKPAAADVNRPRGSSLGKGQNAFLSQASSGGG
jgi:hypothetical protein